MHENIFNYETNNTYFMTNLTAFIGIFNFYKNLVNTKIV